MSLVPAEDAVALRLALSSAERLARLKALRAQHVGCALPAAATLVDREIKQVERSLHAAGSQEGRIVGQQLRAHMDSVMSKEMDLLRARQAASRRRRAARAKLASKKKRLARIKKVAAEKKAELKRRLDDLPLNFNHQECGASGPPGKRIRVQCLERLKLRAPLSLSSMKHDGNAHEMIIVRPHSFGQSTGSRSRQRLGPYSSTK